MAASRNNTGYSGVRERTISTEQEVLGIDQATECPIRPLVGRVVFWTRSPRYLTFTWN